MTSLILQGIGRHSRRGRRILLVYLMVVVFGIQAFSPAVLNQTKRKLSIEKGNPILWLAPENISSRDLFLGPGQYSVKPDLRTVTFIEKEKGGTNVKYRVRDASGQVWVAKLGQEAQSETAAVRLLWAVGYVTEVNYLVPVLNIQGKGVFYNVRLEARPKNVKRLDEWRWNNNPFIGTREFQGLKVMMALINNWDLKDSNNKILRVRDPNSQADDLDYIISDLGATFGKSGGMPFVWRITRSRNKPSDFAKSKFINKVKGDRVYFGFQNKNRKMFGDITVAQANWIGMLLARLSPAQIGDAFRAANYNPQQAQMLTDALRFRISELVKLRPRGGRRAIAR